MIPNELKIPNFSLYLFAYFFGNIIMTGEPAHATSMKNMAPELMFLSERMSHLSFRDGLIPLFTDTSDTSICTEIICRFQYRY